jgi:hypothetical protein
MANEQWRACLAVTLSKPMFVMVEVKWSLLGVLQKQKTLSKQMEHSNGIQYIFFVNIFRIK